jgi:hypothetical protein
VDTGLAILISAVTATLGWLYTGRSQRAIDRRQHTYTLLLRQQDDDKFGHALDRLGELVSDSDIPHPADPDRSRDIGHLIYVLNYYEFMCAAVWCGDIDERLLRSWDQSRVVKLSSVMSEFIRQCQEDRNQSTMFEHLLALADRWSGPEPARVLRLYEAVMFQPCRTYPSWIQWLSRQVDRQPKT